MYQFSIILLLLIGCNTTHSSTSTSESFNEKATVEMADSTEILTMWVHHFKSPCVGEGDPILCLQVQFGDAIEEENWEFFYDEIEGFDFYQQGNVYQLKVSKKKTQGLMADASSFSYHLEEFLSVQHVNPETTFSLSLKLDGVPPFINKNEETGSYLLANQLPVWIEDENIAAKLEASLAEGVAFEGTFKHTKGEEGIVLMGLE